MSVSRSKRPRSLTDDEFLDRALDFPKPRRIAWLETPGAMKAIQRIVGETHERIPEKRRKLWPLVELELDQAVIERAHNVAARRGVGYKAVILETLLKHL